MTAVGLTVDKFFSVNRECLDQHRYFYLFYRHVYRDVQTFYIYSHLLEDNENIRCLVTLPFTVML